MRSSLALAMVLGCAAPALAQQPAVINGQVTTATAPTGFAAAFRAMAAAQKEPAWAGYAVQTAKPQQLSCSSGDMHVVSGDTAKLEGSTRMLVLFRIADRQVERVRMVSEECRLDAGGLPVRWFDNVPQPESIALLEWLATADTAPRGRVGGSALAAMSMHADRAAGEALIRLARAPAASKVRGDALFWLAQRAGDQAVATLTAAIDSDPDTEVKKRAVFALSQLPRDEGVPLLIKVARTHPNGAVKKQAMFWLGQSKDPRAIDFFAEILARHP